MYLTVMPVASSKAFIDSAKRDVVRIGEWTVHRHRRALVLAGQRLLQETSRHHGKSTSRCARRGCGASVAAGVPVARRPGGVDFFEDGVEVSCAGDVVGHTGPEGAGADCAGHQVRAVEAEGSRLSDERRRCRARGPRRTYRAWRSGERRERRRSGASRKPTAAVVKYSIRARTSGRSLNIAMMSPATRKGLPYCVVDGGQVEEVVVHAGLGSLGEEAGDEVALLVQPALGRLFEHGRRRIAEVGGDDAVRAAVDVVVVEPDLAPGLDGFLDFGGVELELALDPLVVVLQRGGAQHHLFDPVGGGPAGGSLRLDADAPGGVAVIGDLLGERHQLVPGGGDGVAGGVEVVLGVPDQALAVEAVPDAAGHGLTIRSGDHAHVQPALVVLLLQPVFGDPGGRIDDVTLAGIVADRSPAAGSRRCRAGCRHPRRWRCGFRSPCRRCT